MQDIHSFPPIRTEQQMNHMILHFTLSTQISINHLSNRRRSIWSIVSQHTSPLYYLPPALKTIHVPGKRMNFTFSPLSSSADTRVWHCVVFPARSRPSKTMSLPRVMAMVFESRESWGTEDAEVADRAVSVDTKLKLVSRHVRLRHGLEHCSR